MEQEKLVELKNVRVVLKSFPYTDKKTGEPKVFESYALVVSYGGREFVFGVESKDKRILDQLVEVKK